MNRVLYITRIIWGLAVLGMIIYNGAVLKEEVALIAFVGAIGLAILQLLLDWTEKHIPEEERTMPLYKIIIRFFNKKG